MLTGVSFVLSSHNMVQLKRINIKVKPFIEKEVITMNILDQSQK